MTEIGYACVVSRKFSNDHSVSFQLNFPLNASAESINTELDRLADIMERQQLRIDVPTLERQIAQQKVNLEKEKGMIVELRNKIDAGPNRELRVNNIPQMKEQYNNALTTYKAMEENLARAESALEDMRKKAA